MSGIQYRGNCQLCGRQHAVNGTVAKHGYTVEHGWFNGVCNGSQFKPMQQDRAVTDKMVSDVREQVSELLQRAADLKSGKIAPATCGSSAMERYVDDKGRARQRCKVVPFAEGDVYYQKDAINGEVYRCESRARAGTSFANDMEKLVNSVHGKPLVEVKKEDKPAPILPGEKRKTANGTIATVLYQDGARVYWTYERDGNKKKSWTGSQAWRKLELLKEEA